MSKSKIQHQAHTIRVTGTVAANTITKTSITLDRGLNHCRGVRVINVTSASDANYEIAINDNNGAVHAFTHNKDWVFDASAPMLSRTKPLDIEAGGNIVEVLIKNTVTITTPEYIELQVVFELDNVES